MQPQDGVSSIFIIKIFDEKMLHEDYSLMSFNFTGVGVIYD
jgi:hypothetical protein